MIRLGILGSTRGTNLLALQEAIAGKKLAARIELVVSNKAEALILEKARHSTIPAFFVDPTGLTRPDYDQQLNQVFRRFDVELIVLIGYMRILSVPFVQTWRQQIINVHPSLLPAYSGLMDLDVHRAVLGAGETQSGCTVHYVTEDVDAGPILIQKTCPVYAEDTPDRLRSRVQQLEGQALVAAIGRIAANASQETVIN
ncbi:phosphoribosylglycinamide formyltransferase [Legionella taurinensis]|uniref:Phosphoribosylglycinamide formyltransferase n=1 Tax=Legionella taurinensis TaxID=70611 RepID=A0AB38N528_9GAMM|nr:phosphoribosylglycinamide formyltransferase [Legionella taurinensis]MDX1837558.1 phosphoribosylglycinamide formyltransferase [Legionella taurinensis]PUT40890.1 phosphoribosylglycinamide formyltransferase [Legionella taurinensis]PUT41645.1 phosphoribosylglycinamide formyltransferase [Legionella taurinensis]PUT44312.1 phosphoribosylglycinamide formyltransferase [Legionella taurinensis]PUT48753.1 phosphoribosylglycinamide formyltransferase [Legionella taurinensis]